MQSTGIVRRMDELGRVVIPKELRRVMRIREGEEVEVFATADSLVLKKFSAVDKLAEYRAEYASGIYKITGFTAIITDNDRALAVAGDLRIAGVGTALTETAESLREWRKTVMFSSEKIPDLFGSDVGTVGGMAVSPIMRAGDVMGYVILLSKRSADEFMVKTADIAAMFIASLV